jgi:hypothetical protein
VNLNTIRKNLVKIFVVAGTGAATVAGIVVYADAPAIHASAQTLRTSCVGEQCRACLRPTAGECGRLTLNGGDPAYDMTPLGTNEPYGGANGKLARVLRQCIDMGVVEGFHTGPDPQAIGPCMTTIFLSRDQRKAWRQTMNAADVATEFVDCRRSQIGSVPVVLFGTDPNGAEFEDSDDAGPEPPDDAGP